MWKHIEFGGDKYTFNHLILKDTTTDSKSKALMKPTSYSLTSCDLFI